MKKLITILLIVCSTPTIGQKHYIGLSGGVSRTQVSFDESAFDTGFRTGIVGGLKYERTVNNDFFIGLDFLYSQRGFTRDFILTARTGQVIGVSAAPHDFNYLSLPIKAGVTVGERLSGFVSLGVVPSILIEAKYTIPGVDGFYQEETYSLIEEVPRFDLGGMFEVGGNYKLNERLLLFTSLWYLQSFTNISSDNYFTDRTSRHYGISLSVGLKYALEID